MSPVSNTDAPLTVVAVDNTRVGIAPAHTPLANVRLSDSPLVNVLPSDGVAAP